MWDSFKSEHGKTYSADEESKRFGIFVENLKVADERNAKEAAAGGSAQHGAVCDCIRGNPASTGLLLACFALFGTFWV